MLTGEALTPLVTARQPIADLVFESEDIVVINHRYGLDR